MSRREMISIDVERAVDKIQQKLIKKKNSVDWD